LAVVAAALLSQPLYRVTQESIMNLRAITLAAAAAFALFVSAPSGAQQTQGKTLTPQQQHMAECSSANKGKTGDAYKSAVSQCLKDKSSTTNGKTLTPQQQRMKDCNAKAGAQSLTGDTRKTFMSTCLKG
jgi:hypothetical protein